MGTGNGKKIEVHFHNSGQLNLAFDHAQIQAQQINGAESDEEVLHELLDVVNGKEYLHEVFGNGEEACRLATEEDVRDFPDEAIEWYKKQLGTRLDGSESKLQIISRLLQEMEETLVTGKRYGVMPMFTEVPRRTGKGYVFLDGCAMPFDYVDIRECYWDAYEKYVIEDRYYHFMVVLHDGQPVFIEFGYTLSFPDVTERLYGFGKAERLGNAKNVGILLPDTNRKIEVDMMLLGKKREEQNAITDYWIEQMKMIDAIEKHYKIKFHLPKNARKNDYHAIDVLYQAINGKQTSTLPPLPMEKGLFRKTIQIKEEVQMNDGGGFPPLELFGYQFMPIGAYLMACTLVWKKKIKAWETNEGGIPIRVEFMCCKA